MPAAVAPQVRESLRGATIDMKIQGHPLQAQVEEAQAQLQQLRRQLPSLRGRDRGLGHRDVSRLRTDVKALRAQLMSQVGCCWAEHGIADAATMHVLAAGASLHMVSDSMAGGSLAPWPASGGSLLMATDSDPSRD